jgi:hypothetical protein
VVAQAAAIEREGWLPALRSSGRLVSDHYGHVFVFLFLVFVVVFGLSVLIELGIAEIAGEVVTVTVELVLTVLTLSFSALATALLYFDLRTRRDAAPASAEAPPPVEHSSDPRVYSDESRPQGWYVNPDEPDRMRFWGGESAGWQGSTRTPRKVRQEWEEKGDEGEP